MIRPTAIPATFENQTGLFRCEPCSTNLVAPVRENGAMPWQRTKLPDTPYQLKPLKDSAPPPTPGGYMAEIDERVRGSAVRDTSPQNRESKVLWAGVVLLSTFCIYCKVTDGAVIPKTEQESIADYQRRMREEKRGNNEEPRPAVRIPELKNRTREGQRP